MDTVISAENISKKFFLSGQPEVAYLTLRDELAERIGTFGRFLRKKTGSTPLPHQQTHQDFFWALKNINFSVRQGDRLGIIGHNGAGKSTLLKILSRITEPTEGRIVIKGRVASLLEVGTGFHPELTGRENIYLNAAILGMRKKETHRKLDAIIAFAELETFIDTPVKRYSSGMYVRLAFSVAAHLDPDILILDEVLAVGDSTFQEKCLNKIDDISSNGRTIIFVSHNMPAVEKFCDRALLIEQGSIKFDGDTKSAISSYLNTADRENSSSAYLRFNLTPKIQSAQEICIDAVDILDKDNNPAQIIYTNDAITIRLTYSLPVTLQSVAGAITVSIKSQLNQEIIRLSTLPISGFHIPRLGKRAEAYLHLPQLPLTGGRYLLDIGISRPKIEYLLYIENAILLKVQAKDVYGNGEALEQNKGLIVLNHRWEHRILE